MTLRSTKKLPISGQLFSVIILGILFFLLEFSAVFCFCGFALGDPLLGAGCGLLLTLLGAALDAADRADALGAVRRDGV